MTVFKDELKKQASMIKTTNGANYYSTTDNHVLDFFANIGTLRYVTDGEIMEKFHLAFIEDPLLAMKSLFYARDIRGGLGERRVFKTILEYLCKEHKNDLIANAENIFEFGRYDDVLDLMLMDREMFHIFSKMFFVQIQKDYSNYKNGKPVSLLAKWLPSNNVFNKPQRVRLARYLGKEWGMTQKHYRKVLAELRKYIDITETHLCEKDYGTIKYDQVPSKAMMKYRQAFARNDRENFTNYIESVKKGEVKINSSTVYPYEIFEKMGMNTCHIKREDDVLEQQFNNLPNYVPEDANVLVMADTSASMQGRPMAVALSLAVYFADRNKGEFAHSFMTFSSRPSFVELKGNTLKEKTAHIPSIVENTDLERALMLILDVALKKKLPQEELPNTLLIISDMQFDSCAGRYYDRNLSFMEKIERAYNDSGYHIPNVIFWNVSANPIGFHAKQDKRGVQLVSGCSPSIFMSVMNIIGKTPYEAMLEILNSPRYDCIKIAERM